MTYYTESSYTKKEFDEALTSGEITIINKTGDYYTIRVNCDFSWGWFIVWAILLNFLGMIIYGIYYGINKSKSVVTVRVKK